MKIVSSENQMMSKDKYRSIISRQKEATVFTILIFLQHARFRKLRNITPIFPILAGEYSVT